MQPSENVGTYAAYFAALCTATFEVERERVVYGIGILFL